MMMMMMVMMMMVKITEAVINQSLLCAGLGTLVFQRQVAR